MAIRVGTSASETLTGTETGDLFQPWQGNDILNGLGGFDYVDYQTHVGNASLFGGWSIDLVGGKATTSSYIRIGLFDVLLIETDTLNSIEGAYGSFKNDTFTMTDANAVYGRNGNDVANINTSALKQVGLFDGGVGIDTAVFNRLAQAVTVNLDIVDPLSSVANAFTRDDPFSIFSRGFAKLRDVENVIGSVHGDILRGNAKVSNNLNGGGGDDRLQMSETAGFGTKDFFNGGTGTDTLDARYFQRGLFIYAEDVDTGLGGVRFDPDVPGDIATLKSVENIQGTGFADDIAGSYGNNTLNGSSGSDYIAGWFGNDWISGGAGTDELAGGTGIGSGDEMGGPITYSGDGGRDAFTYGATSESTPNGAWDTILDFERGLDKIHVAGIDAKTATTANDGFTFAGLRSTAGGAGTIGYYHSNGNTFVWANTNSDQTFDMVILLYGLKTLTAADFVL